VEKLFQPFEAGNITFKNRIIHVPTTMNMSDPAGHVTRKIVAAYETLAKGGYGAMPVGATCVRHDGLINERMLGIYDDTYVIGLRDVVEVIKNNDTLAGIQLFYGGLIPGLGTTVPLPPGEGWIPGTVSWGPSANVPIGNFQPKVIPTEELDSIVESYAQGARRSKEAGFEFVSFHFCHGSLPHVMLSLLSNVGRNDKYADRFLFIEDIIKRTQALCGKDYPIIPRVCCDENLEGGFDIAYFAEHYAPRLHALGIKILDATFGSMLMAKSRRADISSPEFIGPSFYTPKVVNKENIQTLRRELVKNNADMALIGSANLITPDHLRVMVDEAGADFAGVCRLSLDDPDFPNKMRKGQENLIRKSTHTGASLLQGNIFGKGWAGSAQNPDFGRDDEYRIQPTRRPKKVVVVGGGSGGMEYAIVAQKIGHDVVVLEKSKQLGGAMDWAGNYPSLPNMEMLRYQPDYHRAMMQKLGVKTKLGVTATADSVMAEKPDVVVIATGARPRLPNAQGLDAARKSGFVVTIEEAMAREKPAKVGQKVIIYGSGEGGELAINLKREGKEVRLLEAAPTYVPAIYLGSRTPVVMGLLAFSGIAVEGGLTLEAVEGKTATFKKADGSLETVQADTVILALGRESENALIAPLEAKGVEVQVLGDAKKVRSYGNAIHEAAYLARQI
jgi:2,4-dienoyl-CoA reductase-like NADH-dependent reductase (Old Yellow Enzyme family)/thioredoxin reductase